MTEPSDAQLSKYGTIASLISDLKRLLNQEFNIPDKRQAWSNEIVDLYDILLRAEEKFTAASIPVSIEEFSSSLRLAEQVGAAAKKFATALSGMEISDYALARDVVALSNIAEHILGFVRLVRVPFRPKEIAAQGVGQPNIIFSSELTNLEILSQKIQSLEIVSSELDERSRRSEARANQDEKRIDSWLERASNNITENKVKLEQKSEKILLDLKSVYEKKIRELEEKEKQIDLTIGTIASKVISGGYAENAESEKKAADRFRLGAIGLMVIVAVTLLGTLHEISADKIDGFKLAARLAIVLFLTVPITYLARESGKHRYQQLKHLQTSLDLSAINPYIESLAPESREKIKLEMAFRLFFAEDKGQGVESMPLNAHEIIMKLLDKAEVLKK